MRQGVYPRERFSAAETTPLAEKGERKMKKAVSLLLTLILTLSLCTPVLAAPGDNEGDVPQQGQQENNGPQWPKGTEQCFFYEDNC